MQLSESPGWISNFVKDAALVSATDTRERAHHNQAGVVRREDTTASLCEFQGPEKTLGAPAVAKRSATSSVGVEKMSHLVSTIGPQQPGERLWCRP